MTRQSRLTTAALAAVLVCSMGMLAACSRNQPPAARPAPPPMETADAEPPMPPAPPTPVAEPRPMPPQPVPEDDIGSASLDELNRSSPLRPLFFDYDSSEVNTEGRAILDENAAALKRFPTWTVTIEGHCDERGTAEYNLALGERRAVAARTYLVSLGIPADRLRTVSYGKEFPFDPGSTEEAWSKNRRAHFVITGR
jgi:peptidoglycan-associated lipoprotein